jgi:phosphatidylglycerol lysyltransferase
LAFNFQPTIGPLPSIRFGLSRCNRFWLSYDKKLVLPAFYLLIASIAVAEILIKPGSKMIATLKIISKKLYWREVLACLLLIIGIYFFRKQRHEINTVLPYLDHAKRTWLFIAAVVSALFILLQSAMYVSSFASIGAKLKWKHAVELFLKRNLLGVFLPGGGVSALAYIPNNIKRSIDQKLTVHRASGVFAFAGMLSTFIIGLPVIFMNTGNTGQSGAIKGLGITALLIFFVIGLLYSIRSKGRLFFFIEKRFPKFTAQAYTVTVAPINKKQFFLAAGASVGVELCGIFHMYLAMLAVGGTASLPAAGIAYIVSLLLMVASPLLKGLGAVELSIVYVLGQFGYAPAEALAIALVFRVFEFWVPMACGLLAFLLKGKHLFLRIAPAVSIFFLGLINILSVVTPPIKERVRLVRDFIPADTIHTTNIFILFMGIGLMVTAAFLLKGLRNAWWIAIVISFISIFGHLIKALDYEEAFAAALVFTILLFTRDHYKLKSNPKLISTGIRVALLSFVAVLLIGFIGFYFLEHRHFGTDFTWRQSILYSVRGFMLLDLSGLKPLTHFAREFLTSFHILGLLSWAFLFYSLIRPYLKTGHLLPDHRKKASSLLDQYGSSAVDHFKLSDDKLIFLSHQEEGFISYRVSGSFAVALEEPVCAKEHKLVVLKEFENYCTGLGFKTAFYRIDENSLGYFTRMKKKNLLIGQEAILDIRSFDLCGRSKKSLRNGLNSLQRKGYTTIYCPAPHDTFFLADLKLISDEWLKAYGKKEMSFSQGIFDENTLKDQDIIASFDAEGRPVAFLNIIPDFVPGECTYDLIRKTATAPGGCMDALIIGLIDYAKQKGFHFLNLGLAPLSGFTQPENTAEQMMKFAYLRIKRFRQHQGLREFKEKYASQWVNKYLIYSNDFDLLQLPRTLNKIMQPGVNQLKPL